LVFYYLDEPLLLRQEAYYQYVRDLLRYVNYEGQFRAEKLRENIFPLPTPPQKPAFFTRKA